MQRIAIFTTGGTIYSRHDARLDGLAIPMKKSLIGLYLKNLNLHFSYDVYPICVKDSRDINSNDRAALLKAIIGAKKTYNLITHGTYTMSDTARYLKEHPKNIRNKVIVLTGSMATIIGSVDEQGRLVASDAPFNLGFAIAGAFNAKPGLYVAMNGCLFRATEVMKNISKGRFEPATIKKKH